MRVALDVPLDTLFDYLLPESMTVEPGDRVAVSFGTRQRFGLAIEAATGSEVAAGKLKEVLRVLDGVPRLPAEWLDFIPIPGRILPAAVR
jgi:primosomal protein N' (replication factor Y)